MNDESAPALPFDALLVVSFGGPQGDDEVMPFLERVTAGKNVPRERIEEVAEHYYAFEGKSPIVEHSRALVAAIRQALTMKGPSIPVYVANRFAEPFLADTLRTMRDDGIRRALAFVTSAFGSPPGCAAYLEAIEAARAEVGEGAPEIHKLRLFYNHPGFIEPMTERVEAGLEEFPPESRGSVRIAFTAHSIPLAMDDSCPYVAQLEEACTLVADNVGKKEWQLVFQSRSGPPNVPWLGPDVIEHLEALSAIGVEEVLVVPIGFLSDHMEVVWDLDHEALNAARELGIRMVRAPTVGTHPRFIEMIRELTVERMDSSIRRLALGKCGPSPDQCPESCCRR